MNRARWLCLVWCLFAFGVGLLIGSASCHAQATPPADTPMMVPIEPGTPNVAKPAVKPPQQNRDCHHNSKGQLVCRHCWVTEGKVHCGQPRIVSESLSN